MSIKSEIDRISQAKSDIRDSIAERGVEVPLDAGLEEYPSYVALIASTPGSQWYTGTGISGTNTTPKVFSGSGITDSRTNDCYLNSSYGYVYQCVTPGVASVATWKYILKIKGANGDSITGSNGDGICVVEDASVLPTTSGYSPFLDVSGRQWLPPTYKGYGYETCQVAITLNGDVYNYTGNGYSYATSIKGEAGAAGPKGDTGDTGATGPKGDKGDSADVTDIPVATISSDGLMSSEDKTKLNGLSDYTHPETHPASMIVGDLAHRFVTDVEKFEWSSKANEDLSNVTLGKNFGSDAGYYEAPDGLLIQWGRCTTNFNDGNFQVYFPTTFYGSSPFVSAIVNGGFSLPGHGVACTVSVNGVAASQFGVTARSGTSTTVSAVSVGIDWIAIGRWK